MNKAVGPIRKKSKRQRGRKYSYKVYGAIGVIGETLDWVCAERMAPVLLAAQRMTSRYTIDR